jgi:hypothetical protein
MKESNPDGRHYTTAVKSFWSFSTGCYHFRSEPGAVKGDWADWVPDYITEQKNLILELIRFNTIPTFRPCFGFAGISCGTSNVPCDRSSRVEFLFTVTSTYVFHLVAFLDSGLVSMTSAQAETFFALAS